MNFEVISEDVHGDPVRCSYCDRGAKRVVALPLVARSDRPIGETDQWLGVCAFCVLDMAKSLQKAEGKGS